MEDIGRHNAVDKIAGWMFLNKANPHDKVFYTTGRLTTEMVIKTVQMQIPVLVSRSGFTASAVDLAREAGLTLIGRAKGKRFIALSGIERIVFDSADAPMLLKSHRISVLCKETNDNDGKICCNLACWRPGATHGWR